MRCLCMSIILNKYWQGYVIIPLVSKGFPVMPLHDPSEILLYLLETQPLPTNAEARSSAHIQAYLSAFLPGRAKKEKKLYLSSEISFLLKVL